MNKLGDHIRSLIGKNGPLTVARYMELALQHPKYGYYRQHDPLGHGGDFITAPEVSQMFGEMVGLWCAEAWRAMGKPARFVCCELGPGRGTLMQDALRATAKIAGFHQAMTLCLLESNETLRAMQQEKLGAFRPRHVESIDALPALPVIAVANEFFDALPVHQFERTFQGWCERLVTVAGDELAFAASPPDPSFLLLIPENHREAHVGTVHEVSLAGLALMRQLAQHVARHGGGALIVDYGYAVADGTSTLQAVSGHRRADALERPGEVDLTAHVDFGALRQVAEAQGATALGPAGQGEFLQALGIETRALQLKHSATPEQAADIESALHRLTDAEQMGVLFKAMGAVSPQLRSMAGF